MLKEATASALDLHTTPSLLLNVLHIGSALANNLSAKVEPWNGFEIDRDALFRPLAPTERVTLELRLFFRLVAAPEATLVDEVGQLLLHKLVDLLNGFVEAFLVGARDVEVEGRVLHESQSWSQTCFRALVGTYRARCHALVGIVISAGSDIFETRERFEAKSTVKS